MREDGVTVLAVRDDGAGFYDGAEDAQSGLGATIIENLARQYGGEVRRTTPDGGGTSISISLPSLEVKT